MLIFMAGRGEGARKMVHKKKFEHVLFSFYEYSPRNFQWLSKRKRRENEKKALAKKGVK